MSFHIVAGDSAALYREVVDRNIELAICRMIGRLPDELDAEVLFYDTLAVLTAAKNPLTRRRKLTLAQIADEPWMLVPSDSFFGAVIAEAFRANGHEPPRPTVSSLSFKVHDEMLATGRFLTVMPGFMQLVLSHNPPLKKLPVTLRNPRTPIGLFTLKNRTLTPLAQLLIDNVRIRAKELNKS
jgi:DNA-binding transcriptional LysR family regulator